MKPSDIRDIKRLTKIQSSYKNELTQGKVSKKFKPVNFDLVAEFLDNKNNPDVALSSSSDSESEVKNFPSPPHTDSPLLSEIPRKRPKTESPPPINVSKAKQSLISLLNPNETVAQAIQRLRGPISKPVPFRKNIRKNEKSAKPINDILQEDYKTLCQLCSDLIASGIDDIYSLTSADLT